MKMLFAGVATRLGIVDILADDRFLKMPINAASSMALCMPNINIDEANDIIYSLRIVRPAAWAVTAALRVCGLPGALLNGDDSAKSLRRLLISLLHLKADIYSASRRRRNLS